MHSAKNAVLIKIELDEVCKCWRKYCSTTETFRKYAVQSVV